MNEGLNEAWKRAIARWDMKEVLELSIEESCDYSTALKTRASFHPTDTPFSLTIRAFTSMLRIQFLVKECVLVPNSSTLEYATDYHHWAAAQYFHDDLGVRYTDRYYCREYLKHLEISANEERSVQLVLEYLSWFIKLCDEQSDHLRITNIAHFRYKRAQNASVALLSLRRKRPGLASKDVLRLIAQMMMDKRNVAKKEWGRPRFYEQQFMVEKQTKEFVYVFIGLVVLWGVIMFLFRFFFYSLAK